MRLNKKLLILLAFPLSLFMQNDLQAGVVCTGNVCQYIPQNILNELNTVDQSLQRQYTNKVMESMAEASVLTSLNTGLIGKGSINKFEGGLGLALAGVKNEDIYVVHGSTTFPKMPNAGAAFAPSISLGANLGWLLGKGSYEDAPKKSLLHRVSLYAHGFSYKFNNGDIDRYTPEGMNMYGSLMNMGVMARFLLFHEKSTGLKMLGYNGMSVGLGYYYIRQAIHVDYQEPTVPVIKFGNVDASWAGESKLQYDSKIRSLVFDLRTGFRLLYLFNFIFGIGTSANRGDADLALERSGPLRTGTDVSQLSANKDLAKYLNGLNTNFDTTGNLSLFVKGHGRPEYRIHYIIAGTELNFSAFKVLVEAYMAEKAYTANLAFKFSI